MNDSKAPDTDIHELVDRAKKGDQAAFDALAGRYRDRLVSLIRARTGPHLQHRLEAEDVLQEEVT